jgi:four helix bundle protein
MFNQSLRDRTKQFALRVIRMYGALPKRPEARVMGDQVLRSGTSVAANYREAGRARSKAEFVSKLALVCQELDETLLWFELIMETGILATAKLQPLHDEGEQLLRIIASSIRTAKSANARRKA